VVGGYGWGGCFEWHGVHVWSLYCQVHLVEALCCDRSSESGYTCRCLSLSVYLCCATGSSLVSEACNCTVVVALVYCVTSF
jgi:hypothetical protein